MDQHARVSFKIDMRTNRLVLCLKLERREPGLAKFSHFDVIGLLEARADFGLPDMPHDVGKTGESALLQEGAVYKGRINGSLHSYIYRTLASKFRKYSSDSCWQPFILRRYSSLVIISVATLFFLQ